MTKSIFNTAKRLFDDCARDPERNHSLKLTPDEFKTFKSIFGAAVMRHISYIEKDFHVLNTSKIKTIGRKATGLVLEADGMTARIDYDPDKQTMTIGGASIPWKSLSYHLKAINAILMDETAARKDDVGHQQDDIFHAYYMHPDAAIVYGNVYRGVAGLMGMDDFRVETHIEGDPLPYVSIPKEMYTKMRETELLPGNSKAKSLGN